MVFHAIVIAHTVDLGNGLACGSFKGQRTVRQANQPRSRQTIWASTKQHVFTSALIGVFRVAFKSPRTQAFSEAGKNASQKLSLLDKLKAKTREPRLSENQAKMRHKNFIDFDKPKSKLAWFSENPVYITKRNPPVFSSAFCVRPLLSAIYPHPSAYLKLP